MVKTCIVLAALIILAGVAAQNTSSKPARLSSAGSGEFDSHTLPTSAGSCGFAQDFGSRLGRRENASTAKPARLSYAGSGEFDSHTLPPSAGSFGFAQDFGSRLPPGSPRSRLLSASTSTTRPRASDVGLRIGILPPGPLNAITDVACGGAFINLVTKSGSNAFHGEEEQSLGIPLHLIFSPR